MHLSRRARIAVLLAVGAALAVGVGLIPAGANRTKGVRLIHQASAVPPATPPRPTVSSTTSSTTLPTPKLEAGPESFDVGYTSLTVDALSASGTPVSIPTRVWFPKAPSGLTFPLLVFSPGYQINPSAYDLLTTRWAAAGYVVAEPDYPDTALGAPPIESDMVNHPHELEQVITTLIVDSRGPVPFGRIVNPGEVALAGQSDGGDVSLAAAYNTCCRDPRIKAAVVLSGAEATLFGGTYFRSTGPALLAVQGTADSINVPACSEQLYDAAPAPRYYLNLIGATHLSAYTASGPQFSAVLGVTTAFLDGYVKSNGPRISQMARLADPSQGAQLTGGTRAVPLVGSCPGAP